MVAYGLMLTQQFSGINAVIFYGEMIFEMTGVGLDSLVELVILACIQVVSCIIAATLIDKVTRSHYRISEISFIGLSRTGAFFTRILYSWDARYSC